MRPVKTIVIANNREYFSPLDELISPHRRAELKQIDYDKTDFSLFWEGDDKLIIVPRLPDPHFVYDARALMRYRNCTVLRPSQDRGNICQDVLADAMLLRSIAACISSSDKPKLVAWGATESFQELVAYLRDMGLQFETPELPARSDHWTAAFFGSKVGFRQLVTKLLIEGSPLRIPEGWICPSVSDACDIASYFVNSGRGFVVKLNRAFGGWGTAIVSPEETQETKEDSAALLTKQVLEHGPLYTKELVVVEEFIEPPKQTEWHVVPTVDATADETGKVEVKFIGNMRMSETTHYCGIEFGDAALPEELESELANIAIIIGRGLWQFGYRGWFDVDLVVGPNQQLYCIEVNTRRTSPIYAFEIYSRLRKVYTPHIGAAVANDSWSVSSFAGLSYASVKQRLREVLFPIKGEPRGMVIAMSSPLLEDRGKIGYVAVGKNRQDVLNIEAQAMELVK